MRKLFFKSHLEDQVCEKIKSSIWSIFNRLTSKQENKEPVPNFDLSKIKGLADFEKREELDKNFSNMGTNE
jgi:hypothetical protein